MSVLFTSIGGRVELQREFRRTHAALDLSVVDAIDVDRRFRRIGAGS